MNKECSDKNLDKYGILGRIDLKVRDIDSSMSTFEDLHNLERYIDKLSKKAKEKRKRYNYKKVFKRRNNR